MQDETMKTTFEKFPEVILLDTTHKTNDLRMPLYLMLTVDSNGESEVAVAFIVTNEEEQTIRSMIQTFKEHNPAWEQVKVALTDKDMVERKTLTSEMPAISLLICLLQVMRTFMREINTEKMDITAAERTEVLEIPQKLAYSSSEDTYGVNRRIGTLKRVLKNANQKYRAAVLLSTRLATLISECGEEECSDRMDNLKSLVELWEAGKKTAIVEVVQEQWHIQAAAAAILAEEPSTPAIETVEDTANTHTEATEDVQQPDEDLQLLLEESTQEPQVQPTTTRTDKNMKLPPKIPKRGRPKGSQQTVIGL